MRPIGSRVQLTYDVESDDREPQPDEEIVSLSGRTAYLIESVRKVNSSVHPKRFRLRCLKIDPADCPEPDWWLQWYRRAGNP